MGAPGRPAWFVGDLDDPWVAAIAAALPDDVVRVSCAGPWPESLFEEVLAPATLIVHRAILTVADAERLARLRRDGDPKLRIILCIGPHARHFDLVQWSALVDAIVPEATARDTIARHLTAGEGRGGPRLRGPKPRVAVVSANHELRQVLADACTSAGYRTEVFADGSEADPGRLAVWDVPVLEPDWPRAMTRRSRLGTVVALLGFADRALVGQARAHGASACLELPCDLADLFFVLDRFSTPRAEPAHEVPPPPAALRRGTPAVVDPPRDPYN